MKFNNTKYVFVCSAIVSLALGILTEKLLFPIWSPSFTHIHAVAIARDIAVYTQDADAIVIGEIQDKSDPYWNQDQSVPQRDVLLKVDEVLKGDPKMEDIFIVTQGGQLDGKKVLVEDEAPLKIGEKVLLFLGMNDFGDYVVFAGSYGKYHIDSDNQVSSTGDFKMSLKDLKTNIMTELKKIAQNDTIDLK